MICQNRIGASIVDPAKFRRALGTAKPPGLLRRLFAWLAEPLK